jgi:tubulin---tyrosine ligase
VHTLQAAGHTVSVVLPDTQRSWIGKAHIVGQTVKPSYFRPGPLRRDSGSLGNDLGRRSSKPLGSKKYQREVRELLQRQQEISQKIGNTDTLKAGYPPSKDIGNAIATATKNKTSEISDSPSSPPSSFHHPSTGAAESSEEAATALDFGEDEDQEEWLLVSSTPASCVQIGLHHYFHSRGPIDLVVSGPNYGRNTTAVFALSSGTLGGALEAAVCGFKSIALSFAFFDRNHDPEVIAAASRHSVKVIQKLYDNWGTDVHLYSINVPLLKDIENRKTLWTYMLQNRWKSGSCFQEINVPEDEDETADEAEVEIRNAEEARSSKEQSMVLLQSKDIKNYESKGKRPMRYTHKHFKWAPKFKDVYESVEKSQPGNDGWAVKEGYTSVTPLKANFMHVDGFNGEMEV